MSVPPHMPTATPAQPFARPQPASEPTSEPAPSKTVSASPRIRVIKNGPYEVQGPLPLDKQVIATNVAGESLDWQEAGDIPTPQTTYYLCRCGHSHHKPFCDGSHERIGFNGTETADRHNYRDQAELFPGKTLSLTDKESLCAFARFCDPNGRIWNQPPHTDQPKVAQMMVKQANACPGGRLVAWDNKTGQAVETPRAPKISLTEDPAQDVSGPLWVQGGVPVESADGFSYERRNRVALCRCGQSQNKPFCDGSHASVGFKDGL